MHQPKLGVSAHFHGLVLELAQERLCPQPQHVNRTGMTRCSVSLHHPWQNFPSPTQTLNTHTHPHTVAHTHTHFRSFWLSKRPGIHRSSAIHLLWKTQYT